jgi:hypothetical protein
LGSKQFTAQADFQLNIHLFIHGTFNYAVNSTDYLGSDAFMVNEECTSADVKEDGIGPKLTWKD